MRKNGNVYNNKLEQQIYDVWESNPGAVAAKQHHYQSTTEPISSVTRNVESSYYNFYYTLLI